MMIAKYEQVFRHIYINNFSRSFGLFVIDQFQASISVYLLKVIRLYLFS